MLKDYMFIVQVIALLVAEILKVIISFINNRKFLRKSFLHSGGMPSGHSTFVGATLALAYIMRGFNSIEFAITLTFTLIVLYDALHIRREVGNHARILNKLQSEEIFDYPLGHSYPQVIVGFIVGVLISFMLLN